MIELMTSTGAVVTDRKFIEAYLKGFGFWLSEGTFERVTITLNDGSTVTLTHRKDEDGDHT